MSECVEHKYFPPLPLEQWEDTKNRPLDFLESVYQACCRMRQLGP